MLKVGENTKDLSDAESAASNESEEIEDDEDNDVVNSGWVDSVSKILKAKKPKGKKTLVLSRAKKLNEVKLKKDEKPQFEIEKDGEIKEEKPDPLQLLDEVKTEISLKRKKDLPNLRIKPNILDKDRERTLQKIATRGVVQLFNAVRDQQKDINHQLEDAGPLDYKRQKVLKNIDKRQFLNLLMGQKSQQVDNDVKNEDKDYEESEPGKKDTKKNETWSVLRDDFMMGAKLKDWDKNLEEENEME